MAAIFADATGVLLRVLLTDDEQAEFPVQPPGVAGTLDFDPATNAALVADLRASTDAYRLLAGVLTKDGSPVVVAADGTDESDRKALPAVASQLQTYVGLASPTAAQSAAALKLVIRALLYLARRQGAL